MIHLNIKQSHKGEPFMLKKISNNQFAGTEEQKQKLFEVIEKYKDQPGATMPICRKLKKYMDIYRWKFKQ